MFQYSVSFVPSYCTFWLYIVSCYSDGELLLTRIHMSFSLPQLLLFAIHYMPGIQDWFPYLTPFFLQSGIDCRKLFCRMLPDRPEVLLGLGNISNTFKVQTSELVSVTRRIAKCYLMWCCVMFQTKQVKILGRSRRMLLYRFVLLIFEPFGSEVSVVPIYGTLWLASI